MVNWSTDGLIIILQFQSLALLHGIFMMAYKGDIDEEIDNDDP